MHVHFRCTHVIRCTVYICYCIYLFAYRHRCVVSCVTRVVTCYNSPGFSSLPPDLQVFWRSLLSILFTLSRGKAFASPKRKWLLLLRGLCGHIALSAYLESLDRIPLAEAVFLGKVHPMAAAILSYIFLGEALSMARAIGILVSFFGVTMISKPSWAGLVSGDLFGHFLALLAGALSGAAYCCVRCLSRNDSEDEMWTLLALPLVSLPFCAKDAWFGAAKHEASTWAWLLMLGLCTQLGPGLFGAWPQGVACSLWHSSHVLRHTVRCGTGQCPWGRFAKPWNLPWCGVDHYISATGGVKPSLKDPNAAPTKTRWNDVVYGCVPKDGVLALNRPFKHIQTVDFGHPKEGAQFLDPPKGLAAIASKNSPRMFTDFQDSCIRKLAQKFIQDWLVSFALLDECINNIEQRQAVHLVAWISTRSKILGWWTSTAQPFWSFQPG